MAHVHRAGGSMIRRRPAAALVTVGAIALVSHSESARGRGYAPVDDKTKAAAEATLAKATLEATAQRLTVYDRTGKAIQTVGEPAQDYRWPVLSPDGARIVFGRYNAQTKSQDLYVVTRATGETMQLTSDPGYEGSPVWSPDGGQIAYVGARDGMNALYRRSASRTGAEELLLQLPGQAFLTDWSIDSRYLAYSLIGNPARTLDDSIRTGLYVFPIVGPEASRQPIEVLPVEDLTLMGARFSPDGRFLAFHSNQSGRGQIWAIELDAASRPAGKPQQVSIWGANGMATWRRDGKELYFFSIDRELMTVPVRSSRPLLFGSARRLFVAADTTFRGGGPFLGGEGLGSISRDGREIVFVTVPPPRGAAYARQLTVFNRNGSVERTVGPPANYSQPTISPDGRRLAAYRNRTLQVFDVSSGKSVRIAQTDLAYSVVWSPDGRDVAYAIYRDNYSGFYRTAVDGSRREQLLYKHSAVGAFTPITDWSVDGKHLSFHSGNVLWTVSATGEARAFEMPRAGHNVFSGRLSPNGRFFAYVSDESGRKEIYVQPFDPSSGFAGEDAKRQVSRDGGLGMVQWRRDGRELYYVAPDGGVMTVDVTNDPSFTTRVPKLLFRLPETFPLEQTNYPECSCAGAGGCEQGYISRDGEKFVFSVYVPPKRKEITVSKQTLARYTGTYTLAGTSPTDIVDVVVTLEGDDLMFDTGGTKARLYAESDGRFFLKATNGDLEFFQDDRGDVAYFLFYTGGAPRLAIRK
jgi:Tol biopolymer transport system component